MNFHSEFIPAIPQEALTEVEVHPWNTGKTVMILQEILNAHGFRLRVDGDFGNLTEVAVRAFQRQRGLRCDGIVGAKTWAALKGTLQPGVRILKRGHSGSDVYELQGLLQVCGYSIHRSGIFEEETEQALIDFQRKHQLESDGRVKPTTWIVLRGKVAPLPTPPQQSRWFIDVRKWW